MRKRKILVLSITIVAIALILETCILRYVNEKNAQTTSNVLLDRVIAVLDKNESSEERFVKSLKDDYIVRAKAISYIVVQYLNILDIALILVNKWLSLNKC